MSYQIIGSDGKMYGPATREQIQAWITQGRADARTPVLVAGASAWSTLGLLPEFAPLFANRPPFPGQPPFSACSAPPLATHSLATAGLVCGILSYVCCCCCFPFNLLGLIFSLIALLQINEHPERYTGRTQAIIGLVLSATSLVFSMFYFACSHFPSNHSSIYLNGHSF